MNFKRTTIIPIEHTVLVESAFLLFVKKCFMIVIGVISIIRKAISKIDKLVKLPFNLLGLPINTIKISHD